MVVSKGAVVEARRATFLRTMSNRSYFRKMHIPAAMDKLLRALFACEGCHGVVEAACKQEPASRLSKQEIASSTASSEGTDQHDEPPLLPTYYRRNQVLQRCALYLKDDEHRSWPVTYEVRLTSGQRHRRFTNGWAALCKGNGFGMGDKLAISITACINGDGEGGVGSGRGVGILIRRVDQQEIVTEE